mmetsp:Transcript_1490/g.3360  ORF Transcript_1490/g.3360 Transcript_1490/m.3360 type:complete len:463 (+) Transcript_1490:176-1564(+)
MIINGSTKKVAEVLRVTRDKPDDDKEWYKIRNEFRHGGKPFSKFDQCFPGKTRMSAICAATDRVASAKAKPAPYVGPRAWIRHARPASSTGDQMVWKDFNTGYLTKGVGFRTAGTGTWRSSAERVVLDPPSFGEPYRDSRGDLNLKAEGGAIKTSPRMLKRPHTVMGVSRISRSADRSTRSERTGEKPDDDRSATLELDAEDDNGDGIDNDEGTDDDDQDGASDMIGEEEVAQAGRRTSERVEEQNLLKKGDNVSKEVPTPSSYRSPAKNRSSSSQRRPWTSPAVSSQIATAALKSPSSPARPNQRTSSLQEPSAILGRTSRPETPEDLGLPPALRHGRSQPTSVASPAMHKRTASLLQYLSGASGFPLRPRQPLRADMLPQSRNPSSRALLRDRTGAHPGLSLSNPTAPKRLSSEFLRRHTEKMLFEADRQDSMSRIRRKSSGGGVFGLTFANPDLSFSAS